MKPLSILSFLCMLLAVCAFAPQTSSFEEEQKKYPRVSAAYERKEELFFMKCRSKEVSEEFSDMYIRVFKEENIKACEKMNHFQNQLNSRIVKSI